MIHIFIAFVCFLCAIELYIRFFGNYCEPWFDKREKIVKRKPNTTGIYKTEFTSTGYFRINNEGWNSHRDYYRRKESALEMSPIDINGIQKEKKLRIAIVGHSNIEGLRVPVDKTLSKILENDLNENGIPAEVYTFGYGGMHIVQALHVSRYVVRHFNPDLLIIGTMLDNFWVHSTSKKNFLNIRMDSGLIQEVLPQKFIYEENSPFSFLYFSTLIYYLDKKTKIGERLVSLMERRKKSINENKELNIVNQAERDSAYRYIIHEFNTIVRKGADNETPVFFLSFPPIMPSFNYDYIKYQALSNKREFDLEKVIRENNYPVIDLKKAFLNNYKIYQKKFDFINDNHYNEQAHKVIGLYLSEHIKSNV